MFVEGKGVVVVASEREAQVVTEEVVGIHRKIHCSVPLCTAGMCQIELMMMVEVEMKESDFHRRKTERSPTKKMKMGKTAAWWMGVIMRDRYSER